MKSIVYFIGAGPGDPDLLTIKAYKILQQADVIFYADSLVPKQILKDVKSNAQLITTSNQTLEKIVPLMIEKAREGLIVVRLQSGDLSLYSAIDEQMRQLAEANISFELIPGISAYQAAAAKISSELTIPELVQTIILTRVSGSASPVPKKEELKSLAAHQASLCLYLAARHVRKAQQDLLEHYPADTPVAVCYRVGWKDEKILIVPLKLMAIATEENNLIRTTMYIISPALKKFSNNEFRSQLYHPEHSHLFRPTRGKLEV
ncbi:cobalt-precorrin-4 C11-methyltransferase [Geminocystis sp. NIES-3708]|uniref:precorrin-4 C(11)-methyltransferase n=1 Tax=Geminocystis sp. NIES-3708 TaxID=1615909 RepID=UPI0005FC4608|nr:precorrin-4 C(11)-methyltransferase [Geminocystis sp. NIES-3708]BAQ62062.1 cobalt-precorrin-4 C11-methyltransferase [Geminocystis sp. NIES-3708]